MKEYKIGEKISLEVVEADESLMDCEGCFFVDDDVACVGGCCSADRSDHKNIIYKEVKELKRNMKENKHSLKISRSCGNITLDGYPIATYSNDELKILKNLLTRVLGEVNEYIKD